MVTQKEILKWLRYEVNYNLNHLANRIESEGIAPPDGHIIVPTCAVRRKPYVPMTDDELQEIVAGWIGVSDEIHFGIAKSTQAAIIKRAGLEVKHD